MNRTLGRRLRWILAAGGLAVLLSILPAPPALALHDLGNICYTCHSLNPGQIRSGSNAVRTDQPILGTVRSGGGNISRGLPSTGGYPISCDFCHSTAGDVAVAKFGATKDHHHPVDIISVGDNTTNTQEITCNDCHAGDDGGTAGYDLTPLTLLTRSATDGYPDHDNVTVGYAHSLDNNKGHLTKPYWGATKPGSNRANDTTFWTGVKNGTQDMVCWVCHEAGRVNTPTSAPFTGVTSSKSIKSEYTGAGAAKGHQISTNAGAAQLGVGSALPCYNCHDSHGSVNHGLVLDATPIENTSLLAVTTYDNTARPYDDRLVCGGCHDTGLATTGLGTRVEGLNPMDPYNSASSALHISAGVTSVMSAGKRCLGVNGGCHANPHNPVGESLGGGNCGICHSAVYAAMDNGSNTSYHHHMMTDNATVYPVNATPTVTASDRSCNFCHVDHNYFSKLVSTSLVRARNLRRSILVAPDNGTNAPVQTDFDNSLNGTNIYGGICTSCHRNVQTKSVPGTNIKTDGLASTSIVDNTTYAPSAHAYPAAASPISGHYTSDNATDYFRANCSKCHNDTLGTSFQDNNYASGLFPFALHDSVSNKLVAPMGGVITADNVTELSCFRCHSKTTDLVGGTQVKTGAGLDWYKKAAMDNAAEATYGLFNKTGIRSSHPVKAAEQAAGRRVDCVNCHNVHRTQRAGGSIAANPDNTYAFAVYNAAGTTQADKQNRSAYCVKCHDGSGPAQTVSGNTLVPLSVEITLNAATMNKQPATGDNTRSHWAVSGSLQSTTIVACDGCHDKHGSSYPKLLGAYNPATGTNQINGINVPATATAADNNAICDSCHSAVGLGYAPGGTPTLATIGTQESYRNATGYFAPTPSGTVTTTRWPGQAVWDNVAVSPHNTTAKTAPATLIAGSGRQVGDCNSCHDAHGTPATYNMLNDNMVAGNYELCFDCHRGGGIAADNVAGYYSTGVGGTSAADNSTTNVGHNIKTAGGKLAIRTGLPCYDCHVTHGSRNANSQLKSDQRWAQLGDTKLGPSADCTVVDNNSRKFCLGCHRTTDGIDGNGNTVAASDNVENLSRTGANKLTLPTTNPIPEHASSGTYMGCQRCHYGMNYADNTWGPHYPATGICDTCHQGQGARSAAAASYTGAHQIHVDNSATGYKLACRQCHSWNTPTGAAIHKNATGATLYAQVVFDCTAATWNTARYSTPTLYDYRTMFNNPYTAAAVVPSVTLGADNATVDSKQSILRWRQDTCNNIWCHSNANPDPTRGATNVYTNPVWRDNSLSLNCTGCHGGDATSGFKIGDNTSARNGSVSHLVHINAGYGCYDCHNLTVNTVNNRQIDNVSAHVDGIKHVKIRSAWGASASYDNGAHTCANVSCHGTSTPDWDNAATATCSACHISTTGDVEDYGNGTVLDMQGNGKTAKIDNAQLYFSGHAKTSGTYDKTGHPAANFGSVANTNLCLYCHTTTAPHDCTTNPFRLANYNYGTQGWNGTCMVCHRKTPAPSGYDPDGAGAMVTENTTDNNTRVDNNHAGGKHTSPLSGGEFCWDCHSHGDSSAVGGQIFMVRSRVHNRTDNVYGMPVGGTADNTYRPAVVFTDNANGGNYASTDNVAPFNGICEVCHTSANHYRNTGRNDSSHATGKCIACHSHSANPGFKGAGDCISCHTQAYPNSVNVRALFNLTRKHVDNTTLKTLDCEVCHHGNQVMGAPANTINLRNTDTGADITYTQDNTAAARLNLNTFCLTCHDANGATYVADGKVVTPLRPFSDCTLVVNVSQYWVSTTTVSHDNAPSATFNTVPVMTKARSPHGFPGTNKIKPESGVGALNQATYSDAGPVSCLQCHPAHAGSTRSPLNRTGAAFPGDNTFGGVMINSAEPQLCWNCHDATAIKVKDYWGDSTTANQHWTGNINSTFTFKQRAISSTHNVGDNASAIVCSLCHNPHGAVSGPKYYTPMLRGTWLTSPYFEDRVAKLSNTTQKATVSVYSKLSQSRFGPRGEAAVVYNRPTKIGNGYNDCTSTGHDGYFLDENTFGWTGTQTTTWAVTAITAKRIPSTWTDNAFGGLCAACHVTTGRTGGTVAQMKTFLQGQTWTTAWSAQIHNTVRGWANGPGTTDRVNSTYNPRMHGYPLGGGQACGSYQTGCSSSWSPWRGYNWATVPTTVNQMNTGADNGYHAFPCSKCHTPHASHLPRLMTTNCLDVGAATNLRKAHNSEAAWNYPIAPSQIAPTTGGAGMLCHGRGANNKTAAGDNGWNKVTGW